MCFFFSLMPATFFVIIGYFVLFSSTKAEGGVRRFGQVLAIWIFIIAAFFPLTGLYVTLTRSCPMGEMMQKMHSGRFP
jgi:hypothetical protein